MGTRSIIRFVSNGKHLVDVYRQYDGHPWIRGRDLLDFIAGGTLVNGFGGDAAFGNVFNGIEDLAAQWIEYEKDHQVGNVYINQRITKAQLAVSDIEYLYEVQQTSIGIEVSIYNPTKLIFATSDAAEGLKLLEYKGDTL